MLDGHGIIEVLRLNTSAAFLTPLAPCYTMSRPALSARVESQQPSRHDRVGFVLSSEVKVSLSQAMQLGKAAEHLVCADLILRGYNAFLADQGLPYDVILHGETKLWRVQVKSRLNPLDRYTTETKTGRKIYDRRGIYRFDLRSSRPVAVRDNLTRAREIDLFDIYAFVALDIKKIAYIPVAILAKGDFVTQCVELRHDKRLSAAMNKGIIGGRFFEDYEEVPV